MPKASPWWAPDIHADRRGFLIGRNRIQAALRGFFAAADFVEVETAALQVSPGNEAHLHAFATEAVAPDGERTQLFLHTSPEFACKKLLAAGETRIVSFARVYRNRERGPLHHPEFTMLEWYRAGETYDALMRDCAELLAICAEAAGTRALAFRGRTADPFLAPERLTRRRGLRPFRRDRSACDRRGRRRDGPGWACRCASRCGDPRRAATTPGPTCSAA